MGWFSSWYQRMKWHNKLLNSAQDDYQYQIGVSAYQSL